MMGNVRRRTRTGCRTCRARRVKCDERKPTCNRCEVANVQCAGYPEKRLVKCMPLDIEKSDSASRQTQPAPLQELGQSHGSTCPRFREDGLPLIALPNNPNPSQRPHSRARDILAYHQFLFRTLPVLFFSQDLHFWKESVCEAAWETEYVYDAVVAIGGMHRAILMLSQPGENDKHRGMDTKVIAVQSYVMALQELAGAFDEATISTTLVVAVLILFAYFECFSENVSATIKHVRMAHHYFRLLSSGDKVPEIKTMLPLESALRQLSVVCLVVLPLPTEFTFMGHCFNSYSSLEIDISREYRPQSMQHTLRDLYNIVTADKEVMALIWMPATPFLQDRLSEKVPKILRRLDRWETTNRAHLIEHQLDDVLSKPVNSSWETVDNFSFPPEPFFDLPLETCFALILYTFCRLRLLWAVCILDPNKESCELDVYFYLYQHLRLVNTSFGSSSSSPMSSPIFCESLNVGVGSTLYLSGHCCPKFGWLQYIIGMLEKVGSQGLFDVQIQIKSLENLRLFEERASQGALSLNINSQLSAPSSRVFSILLPAQSGRGYVAYYATRRKLRLARHRSKEYSHLGTIGWANSAENIEADVASRDCSGLDLSFGKDWLLEQQAVKDWIRWGEDFEFLFDFDGIFSDHIHGSPGVSSFDSKRGHENGSTQPV